MGKISPFRLDVLLAVTVTAVQLLDLLLADGPMPVLGPILAVAAGGVMLLRSTYPRVTLLLSLAGALAYGLVGTPSIIQSLPILLGVYTVIDAGHWRLVLAVVLPVLMLSIVGDLIAESMPLRRI